MFPLPIGLWINIGMAVIAISGIAYGKYESYKLDAYKVAQIKIIQEKQQEYQIQSDQIRRNKDAQIEVVNNQLVNAISELRKRSSRTDQTINGQAPKACNGSQLYAEDSEFLAREAARADKIRIALDSCYKQYDSIK